MSFRLGGGLALLSLALLLAVAATGCGSKQSSSSSTSSSAQTANWVDGMCSALVSWGDGMQSAGKNISGGQLSKANLQKASEDADQATAKLRDDLKSLGKPPTPGAKQAKTSLQQLADDLGKNLDTIRQALAGTSSGGAAAAIPAVTGAVQAMGHELQATTTELKSLSKDEAWKKAFQSSDACQKLTR